MDVKLIVFDLDGVYFLDSHSNFKKNMQERFDLSLEDIVKVYFSSEKMSKVKKNKITSEEFWNWAIKEWNINTTREELLEILVSSYKVNDKAIELIKKLKEKGYKIGVCTNNFEDRIDILEKKFNFLKDFDTVVLSYKEGILKPDKRIYDRLCELSGLDKEEIVVSDDDSWLVDTLDNLGFKAILYKDFDQFQDDLIKLGVDV